MTAKAAVAIRIQRRTIEPTTASEQARDQASDDDDRPDGVQVRELGEQGREALQEERDAESGRRARDRRFDPAQAERIADLSALGRGGDGTR